jgi:hypothetical protein
MMNNTSRLTALTLRRPLVALTLCTALVAACSGGGGGGGGGGGVTPVAGATDFVITDAPVDELLSFSVTIDELRLVDAGGTATANVLLGETSIDLIGAGLAPRWVTRGDLPEGTFTAVRMSLVAGSASAVSRGGAPVSINMLSTSFDAPFAAPVSIHSSSYGQVSVDVDLASSLSGDVNAPPLDFDPQGVAGYAGNGASVAIDEVKGVVQSANAANESLVIAGFADGDQTVSLGDVTVDIEPTTLLLDHFGAEFASHAAFFASLAPATTLLEVHGNLVAGHVKATRIDVEDSGSGDNYVVKIDGRISNLDTLANSFDLLIIEVEKGDSVAAPVLGGLGHPASIAVLYDPATLILLDDHTLTDESSLSGGQRVKVKFATFVNTPFSALAIEVEDQPEFEGVITDVSGLPSSIVINLGDDEPGIDDGQVSSSNTPVTVDLSASTLTLDTHAKPALGFSALQTGMKIEIHGAIAGPSSGPTITASRAKVHSGRFRGDVTSVSPGLHSFNATMSDLKDSFGDSVTFGNVTVDIAPGCEFRDDAANQSEFFALFNGLALGDSLQIEVFGVGTSTPNEIAAYEIKAKVH